MDNFILSLGNPGRYQIISSLLLWTNTFPLAFNNFIMVFYGIIPKHRCKETIIFNNITSESCFSNIDPYNQSLGKVPCQNGWEYDPDIKDKSLIAEWDLICDKKWQFSFGVSLFFVGVMIGGLLGGYLADRFGRQPIILSCIYMQTILGISAVFASNYLQFIIIRFFQAILVQPLQICSYGLIMEQFPSNLRAKVNSFYSLSWTVAIVFVSLNAWLLKKWQYVHLVISVPSLISFLYFWFIPESMRWLISHHKVDKAEALAIKILKFNRINITVDIRKQIDNLSLECSRKQEVIKIYGLLDLIRTRQIRKYTLINAFLWFTIFIMSFGILYGLPSITSNIYLSIILTRSVDIPLKGFSFLIIQKFGRLSPIITCTAISALCCLTVPVILHFGDDSNATQTASTGIAIIGYMINSFSYSICCVYIVELYPTVIRTYGQGCATFFGRIGSIIAPQFPLLGSLLWQPLPFLLCGILGIIAVLLSLMLPDTHNRTFPDMIEDIENVDRRKSLKSSESRIPHYGPGKQITNEITNQFDFNYSDFSGNKSNTKEISNNLSYIQISRL